MKKNLKIEELSIIIPIYNEAKNIRKLSLEIKKNLKLKKFEIIFVDDDSKDNSAKILSEVYKKDKKVRFLIRKNKIKDLSKSCILGFNNSKYNNILVMDGDFQHDPKYIKRFLHKYNTTQSDIVVGCRNFSYKKKQGLGFLRTFTSVFLIYLINFLLGKKTSDPLSGFFLFKKELFVKSKKKIYGKGFKILADIIYNNHNINISDVKINFKKRLYGKSKINLKILFYLLIFIIGKFKL